MAGRCWGVKYIMFKITLHFDHTFILFTLALIIPVSEGAQWLSGRVLDSRPRGRGLEPHRHHCVAVLELNTGSTKEDPSLFD